LGRTQRERNLEFLFSPFPPWLELLSNQVSGQNEIGMVSGITNQHVKQLLSGNKKTGLPILYKAVVLAVSVNLHHCGSTKEDGYAASSIKKQFNH